MKKQQETRGRLARLFDRLVICLSWAWSWRGFWKGWWYEVKGIQILLWLAIVASLAVIMQVMTTVFYPLWRLIIEPIKVSLTQSDKAIQNLKKIMSR